MHLLLMQDIIWKNSNIADTFSELGSMIPSGTFSCSAVLARDKVFIDKHFPSF